MHDRISTPPRKKSARPRDRERPAQHKNRPSRFWQTLRHLLLLSAWGVGIVCGILGYMAVSIIEIYDTKARSPEYDISKLDVLPVTTLIYDRSGEIIGRIFTEDRTILSHEQIPQMMRNAVVAIEDERFYYHNGIDYIGLTRAVTRNLLSGKLKQGGSSISQQLAKHLMNNFSRTLDRKLTEFFVARRLEQKLSKEKILDYYLNRIYFGKGHFGLASAARGYFGKNAMDLTVGECAMLAGIIRAPNSTSPRRDPAKARDRRNIVLGKLRELGYITPAQEQESRTTTIYLAKEKPIGIRTYYTQLAIKELMQVMHFNSEDDIWPGLRIVTTIDMRMQRAAEQALEEQATQVEADIAKLKEAVDFKANPLQGACIVADSLSGAVRVLIGGRNFVDSPFDRATQARRENGALIYPLLYLKAFQSLNFSPASMINAGYFNPDDVLSPQQAALGNPQKDIGVKFMTLRDALVNGNQFAAIRLALHMGLGPFYEWIRASNVGIQAETPKRIDLSNLTLWEICNLYQVFNHNGQTKKLHIIASVTNQQGDVIFQEDPKAEEQKWANPLDTQILQQTLISTTAEGQGRRLKKDFNFPAPVAGMPAYSTGYRDAYYVGFTPTLMGAVWLGFDSSRPIGNRKIARSSAIPLWASVMQSAVIAEPKGATFPLPTSKELLQMNLDRNTGELKGVVGFVPSPGCTPVWMRNSSLTNPQNLQSGTNTILVIKGTEEDEGDDFIEDPDSRDNSIPTPPRLIPSIVKYRLPAMRGNIITADGKLLATMRQSHNLVLPWPSVDLAQSESTAVAWARTKMTKAAAWLRKPVVISDADLQSQFTYKRFQPITIAEDLTPDQIEAFPNSPLVGEGFFLQGVPRRVYPQSTMASHSIGYLRKTQGVSKGEYKAGEVMYEDFNGGSGLELVYNTDLKGEDGQVTIATSPEGYTQRAVLDSPATPGKTLRTTLNYDFQMAAE
ncbi:MAG TPA: transglycosylase domain-containing protein, partial [Candidatus Methylacidiphilales bacterium]|nr:transglycosylase domain-containing protein [Candidatus Methylacidiphilales bacterium]